MKKRFWIRKLNPPTVFKEILDHLPHPVGISSCFREPAALEDLHQRFDRLNLRSLLLILVGLTGLAIYLTLFLDPLKIIGILERANLAYYTTALLLVVVSMIFFSLSWRSILQLMSIDLSFRRVFHLIWVSVFVDLLIPTESFAGEFSRIYLASNSLKKDVGKVTASVLVHRLLSSTFNLSGLLVGSLSLLTYGLSGPIVGFLLAVSAGTAFVMCLAFTISVREELTFKMARILLRFLSMVFGKKIKVEKLRNVMLEGLRSFHSGVKMLSDSRRSLVKPVFYSLCAWLSELAASLLVFYSVGYLCPISLILVLYTLMYTIQSMPVGITGAVGVTEVALTTFLTVFNVPINTGAAVVLLMRAETFWFKLITGFFFTVFLHEL